MDRRNFLAAVTATATTVGLAGCAASPGTQDDADADDEPDNREDADGTDDDGIGAGSEIENTPEEAVEQYFTALSEGDRESREAVLHSENPELDSLEETTDAELEEAAQRGDITVTETTVVESDDGAAIVEVSVELSTAQGTASATDALELAVEDDWWKIKGEATIDRTGEITEDIPEDPVGVIVQFMAAIDVTDVDRMAALIHPDSPLAAGIPFDPERYDDVDTTVEETVLIEEADDEAIVEATVTLELDSRAVTQTEQYRLRLADGEWRFFEYVDEAGEIEEPIPEEPTAIVEQYFAALDVADVDRILALEHEDSPDGTPADTEPDDFDGIGFTVEETVLIDETEEEAIVEATITVTFEGIGEETNTDELTLRRQDGNWRLWVVEDDDL